MSNDKLEIYYFSGTHWDREWYQPFQGYRHRLVNTLNELIDVLEKDPEFKVFHLDGQTVVLEDFLEIEPDKKARLEKLIGEGRLVVGPWYVMPDEFLLSGESLIRNLMRGFKIARDWGTEPWKYGYMCDIFGHIAQMPQIFNGFGIQYALLGRGTNEHTTPAHFLWKSPDGSGCITFKLQDKSGYSMFLIEVLVGQDKNNIDNEDLRLKIKNYIEYEKNRSNIPVVLVMDSYDHEPVHKEVPQYMGIIKELYPEAGVHQVNLEEMGRRLEAYKELMPVKAGELNETAKIPAQYIHLITHTLSSRYPIKKQNDECQTLLEKWIEPMTAISDLLGFTIQKSYVDLAYKYLLQNHPHDSICGCSIDQVHKDMEYRFDQCKTISFQLMDELMANERRRFETGEASQTRVLQLWNPLPFARRETVTTDIDFNRDYRTIYQEPFGYEGKNSFRIFDYQGKEVPYCLVKMKKNCGIRKYNQFYEPADIYTVAFEAELPAMGKAEYKIVPFEEASRYPDVMTQEAHEVENEYLKLKINIDGTLNLHDKLGNKSYDNLLCYMDDGEIGDGWYHANPAEDRLITDKGSECIVERVVTGPSRTVFKITRFMKIPDSMDYHTHGMCRSGAYVTMKICSFVGLSKGGKHVDIETTVSNTAKDHRLRLRLKTNIKTPTFFADQAFTFVERNTGINQDTRNWSECDVPEKQMGGIVGKRAGDGTGLAFISAYGLHECAAPKDEQGSLDVTLFRSFGKTFMTNGEEGGQLIGDLNFKYVLVPLQSDTTYADLTRIKDCIQTGIKSNTYKVAEDYSLSMPQSYFELIGGNICMSVLKRPESGGKNKVAVRLYNMSDAPSEAEIRCFRELDGVEEANLNEEYIRSLPFEKNKARVRLDAWKVQTLILSLH